MLFGMTIEKDPLQWADFPAAAAGWVQVVGGFAALGLVIWFVFKLTQSKSTPPGEQPRTLAGSLLLIAVLGAAAGYLAWGGLRLLAGQQAAPAAEQGQPTAAADVSGYKALASTCATIAGGCALFAVVLPFLRDLGRLRWRRIAALSRLSFKEALRRKILWAFALFFLIVLFASWFIESHPKDQVRTYVHIIYLALTVMMFVTAGLLAAFSLPADIKNQTIHTIVTKPVERFEIVLGRFLGYTALMTLILLVLTGIGLLYLVREIPQEAVEESLRARVPIYGDLEFEGAKGDSVGREWEYRKYISGGNRNQKAVWSFARVPGRLAQRTDPVRCEFTFDIFRTAKARKEGAGVLCTMTFQTWRFDPRKGDETAFSQERERERSRPDANYEEIDRRLAEKYGYYEIRSKQIYDYHIQSVEIPPALFKNALQGEGTPGPRVPLVQVKVNCNQPQEYLGMAKYDLYLLDADGWFPANFLKGAVGLWLSLCVVIGLAVTLSTYLSGVISFLTTMFLVVLAYLQDFIQSLAEGTSVGGGPMESLVRLVNKENMASPLDQTAGASLALGSDEGFKFLFRVLLAIIPDINRLDWTDYVAEGFNISGGHVLIHLVWVAGYLIPCGVLAYYLLKSREVAS